MASDWRQAIITHGGTGRAVRTRVGHFRRFILCEFFWWFESGYRGFGPVDSLSIFISKASLGRRARQLDCF